MDVEQRSERVEISVVVPAFNEEEVLGDFYDRTVAVLSRMDVPFEIVFVNDGSNDGTFEVVAGLHWRDPRVKLIDLSRNFGKEIAVTAGLDFAKGDMVVVIDADLQDPPELIPEMVRTCREGYDTVFATRSEREGENFLKKATAAAFYRVVNRLAGIQIPKNTGDFRVMSRRTVDALKRLREHHRFMKGLFSWVGFKQTSILYKRHPRRAGNTKWNYWRLWNFAIEGITSFSTGPLIVAAYMGLITAAAAFCYAVVITVRTIVYGVDVPGYASLLVTVLFFSGVQLLTLGVLGEYVGRMFNETKRRPLYLVQDLKGFPDAAGELVFLKSASSVIPE